MTSQRLRFICGEFARSFAKLIYEQDIDDIPLDGSPYILEYVDLVGTMAGTFGQEKRVAFTATFLDPNKECCLLPGDFELMAEQWIIHIIDRWGWVSFNTDTIVYYANYVRYFCRAVSFEEACEFAKEILAQVLNNFVRKAKNKRNAD